VAILSQKVYLNRWQVFKFWI